MINMSRNFKSKFQYFICYRSEKTPGTNFAFNLRTSTNKTLNLCARVFTPCYLVVSGFQICSNKIELIIIMEN